jgi:predicted acyl esterase
MTRHPLGLRVAAAATALPLLLALGACTSAPSADVATDTDSVTHSGNDRVPEGAAWTQHYFPSADGSDVELHADVLLPEGLEDDEEVPVILSVGAYFGHAGELAVEDATHTGPSARFDDLVEGGDLFDEGYALVMVDLRGYGGSSGCQDFTGAGERADVEAAIDWAASRPWSTGSVGMYGKSYDAITGLVGNNLGQDALKAVVAQEPMWDPYRTMRSNGVPRSPIVDSSRSYNEGVALPAMPDDDKRYRANAEAKAADLQCAADNTTGYRTADPASEYWTSRDIAQQAAGTDTPLFFTQGFLEVVTEPHGMDEFLANHEGPERGWLGQWNHVRGNDRDEDDRLQMGREGWFEETMAFYDEHLKGIEPSVDYPAFAVQDSTGAWRAQDTWPVGDGTATIPLAGGSYLDDGAEGGPAVDTGNGFVQQSAPVAADIRVTGTPQISIDAEGHGTVMVRLHDVAPDGSAVMFDEMVSTLASGTTDIALKSTDWTLAAGHTLAVEIGTIRSGPLSNWIDTPGYQDIRVDAAELSLPLDDPADDTPTPGDPSIFAGVYAAVSTAPLAPAPTTFTLD